MLKYSDIGFEILSLKAESSVISVALSELLSHSKYGISVVGKLTCACKLLKQVINALFINVIKYHREW